MATAHFSRIMPFPRQDIWNWHSRPGAVRRLTPPFVGTVVSEPQSGLTEGGRVIFQVKHLPGASGRWISEIRSVDAESAFADHMVRGPLHSWVHNHVFEDLGSATRIGDEIEFALPGGSPGPAVRAVGRTTARMMDYRHAVLLADLEFAASHSCEPLRIAVSGASGLIGRELVALLRVLGHEVAPVVRNGKPRQGTVAMDAVQGWVDEEALAGCQVVIHLAGEPIGSRFTDAHKQRVMDSRIGPTRLLAEAAARVGSVHTFVSASAIGYYGAEPQGEVSESAAPGSDFLAAVCAAWEEATAPAAEAGLRVVNVRTGIVLTPAGGALAQQLPLFRAGIGGPLAGGKAWQSWISIDDVVGIYAHAALAPRVVGPVNAVAPVPVTTHELARELGRVMLRPALVPVPKAAVELLLGKEGSTLLALASQRVSARKIVASGYEFRHPTVLPALRHLLGVAER